MLLDINKLKKQLDNADIYEDEDGNKLQTIYLGDIRNITPSGKVYTIFACGNLELCTRCNATGEIKNKHGKRKKHEKILKKFRLIWPTVENVKLVTKLQKQRDWWSPMLICPECHGHGSLEARLDEDWWKQLETELDEIGAWSHISEEDGCDVMISRKAKKVDDDDTR
jgi:hypothetical protein